MAKTKAKTATKKSRLDNMLKRVYGTTKVSKEKVETACLRKYGRKDYPK